MDGLPIIDHECQVQYLLEYQVASTSDVRSKMSRLKVGTSHRCPEGSRCSGRTGQDSDGHEWGLRSMARAEKGTDASHETVKSNVSSSCRRDWGCPGKERSGRRGLRSGSVSPKRHINRSRHAPSGCLSCQGCLRIHVVESSKWNHVCERICRPCPHWS